MVSCDAEPSSEIDIPHGCCRYSGVRIGKIIEVNPIVNRPYQEDRAI